MPFTKVEEYTTFSAEYSDDTDSGDLTIHLYRPEDAPYSDAYFSGKFADVLSVVAIKVFGMQYPQLAAAWTPEVESWWLRARGVGLTGNSEMLCRHFFATLDVALDQALQALEPTSRLLSRR